MDEKTPVSSFVDYDSLSEEEYFKEMENKVAYYKHHFPDMYEKAVQWMGMLNESEVYRANAPNDPEVVDRKREKATDLLKNVRYNGWGEQDLTEADLQLLGTYYPDWLEDHKED